MSGVRHVIVTDDQDGQRIDRWLKKQCPSVPYPLLRKLMRTGQIRVDGKRVKAENKLVAGQDVRLPPINERPRRSDQKKKLTAEDVAYIKSLVIYDDGDIIALNKPQGLASQGGTNQVKHVDGLLEGLTNRKGQKPHLIHRLDKDTSGVMLLARSPEMIRQLGKAFKQRDVKKIYWAITVPAPDQEDGTITAPLVKAGGENKEKMVVDEKEGKWAVTDFIVLERAAKKAAFVAFWPRTGRTHQIRVHAAAILGCPVVGDGKYGGREARIEGMGLTRALHLHARRIMFFHPLTKKKIDITAPLPDGLQKSWKALGFNGKDKSDPFADTEI